MKQNIVAATILAVGLIFAAFVASGGRYYFIRLDAEHVARGDRWTGKVETVTVRDKKWEF